MRALVSVWLLATVVLAQDAALRSFLVASEGRAMAWLTTQDPTGAARTLAEARDPNPLPPGYHVLSFPGTGQPLRYVAVVPRAATAATGRPLLVAYTPPGPNPPDELPVRAAYGGFLDEGFTLLVPIRPGGMGLPDEPTNPERNAWSTRGRELMAGLVADLKLRTPIDDERVFLLGRWTDRPARLSQPAWPSVDATPFAACWIVLPGGSSAPPPDDPGRWQGRAAVFLGSRHNPDATAILAGRLRALDPPVDVRSVIDRRLDWAGQVVLAGDVVRRAVDGLRRVAEPDRLDFLPGKPHARGHEWITAPVAQGVRLVASRSPGTIVLTTPGSPQGTLFPVEIWFSRDPGELRVTFNGRPVFGGEVPHDARTALRCLRHQARTGRRTVRVLTLRP